MGRQALSKIRISKKVTRKNRVKTLDRNLDMASLGGFEPTTRCLEGSRSVR